MHGHHQRTTLHAAEPAKAHFEHHGEAKANITKAYTQKCLAGVTRLADFLDVRLLWCQ
jgi:hypothetical protein